jgi:predicted DsbA family dithiol-disulfide isomerase
VSPHFRHAHPVTLILYEDPLSPWCLVAERRILTALEDVEGAFGALQLEPYPTRLEPRAMTKAERRALARAARKAAREPEAAAVTDDLWLSPDPPLTSIPALTALAAARLQGPGREAALRHAIREASLVRGLNVARTDVLLELAERAGLDLHRFAGALAAPATERRVREVHERAFDKGIRGAPALVIGDEWLVTGPRSVDEYRTVLQRYASAKLGLAPLKTLH